MDPASSTRLNNVACALANVGRLDTGLLCAGSPEYRARQAFTGQISISICAGLSMQASDRTAKHNVVKDRARQRHRANLARACALAPGSRLETGLLRTGLRTNLSAPSGCIDIDICVGSRTQKTQGSRTQRTAPRRSREAQSESASASWPALAGGIDMSAELPGDARKALVSWKSAQEYDRPTFEDFAGGQGSGQFEKVYDLGAVALDLATPEIL